MVKTSKVQEALNQVLSALGGLEKDDQEKVLKTAVTFCDLALPRLGTSRSPTRPNPDANDAPAVSREPVFSDRTELSPKEFLFEKAPKTDIERVACLAYFLTHFRNTPYYKTIDITRLNTEAAQLKLSNPAQAVSNANTRGLLASAGKSGAKQISALGEQYVSALPDREAVLAIAGKLRKRKSGSKTKKSVVKRTKKREKK